MERIAESAGVSRSTVYRRYASKEDIVLEVPRQFLAAWDAAVEGVDPGTSLRETMQIGCLAVSTWIDDNAADVLTAYQALAAAPTLQAADTSNWVERMIELITTHESDIELASAATIAGAYMGAIDTMMHVWVDGDGTTSVVDATREVLDLLEPILPA